MKQFYYELNGQQTGPITVDELRPLQINGETLIWYEGLSGWTKAKDITELTDYLNKLPPPLPPRRQIKVDSIYDLTYEKETDVIIAGVGLLLTPLFLKLTGVFTFDTAQAILALVALLVRVVVTLWVVSIAGRQNRNTTGWGFYAFFLPSISLINIGCLRRLKVEGQPSFAEIKKDEEADHRTEEQKKIDDEKFKRQDKTLRIIIFTMIIGGFVALFAIMFFW
jgi:RsiW-degrading membrane proteinase PrsW (M82 family)